MPDMADTSCIHLLADLTDDDNAAEVVYACMDCGHPYARFPFADVAAGRLEVMAARSRVPERIVARYLRRMSA